MRNLLLQLKDSKVQSILIMSLFINAGIILLISTAFVYISNQRDLNKEVDRFSYTRGIFDLSDTLFQLYIVLGLAIAFYGLYIQRQKKKHLQ